MNYMSEVAKMLGVELEEEFEIIFPKPSSCHATAKFTDNGVKIITTDVYDVYNFKTYVLKDLLIGSYGIKRKPWKPQEDELYFYVDEDGLTWHKAWNEDYLSDCMNYYKLGNCYRTKEEAEANSAKWKAFYASDEVLEV